MSIRSAPAWLVCALLTLAPASSASAASNNGAQVTKTRQCDVIESGTVCIDDHVVSNFVSTPSGTTVIVGNTRFHVTFTGSPESGVCSFEQSGQEQFRAVFGPHTNVSSDLFRQEFRFPTGCTSGPILVCESVMQFHQVNGILQFQRARSECTEEPAP
jgi:hypothetical protein